MLNRHKFVFIPVTEYALFPHQAKTLKTNHFGLVSNISKYYCKTGTVCLPFVPTALEFDCNNFGSLLWKTIKPHGHNEIKPQIKNILKI